MDIRVHQEGKTKLRPQIEHIRYLEWAGDEIQAAEDLKMIRKQDSLTRILTEEPDIETWLSQEYTEQDIEIELMNLENRKSHGESYKALGNGNPDQKRN